MHKVLVGGGDVNRAAQTELAEYLPITFRVALARGGPACEIGQLHTQNGRLERVQSTVAANNLIVVLLVAPVHAQQAQSLCKCTIVRSDDSTVSGAAKILGREEAETSAVTDRSDGTAAILGANRL